MDRREFIGTVVGGLLAAPLTVEAQPAGKRWRIGYLTSGFREEPGSNPSVDPFLRSPRELAYVEGRNVTLEIRYAEGRTERFPPLATELVNLKGTTILTADLTVPIVEPSSLGEPPLGRCGGVPACSAHTRRQQPPPSIPNDSELDSAR